MTVVSIGCASSPPAPVCVGGGSLDGARCRAQEAPRHWVPFREGFQTKVMQGYHGGQSHTADLAMSVDLKCNEGDPIAASRDGTVWSVKEDSDAGCADRSCMHEANYVILDHGDGTFSEYYHLRHLGVLVEEGDRVCAGQVIGLCGNTGYSTGAHLHFAVTDLAHRTVPFQFREGRRDHRFGFPIPDTELVSRNRVRRSCNAVGPSTLGRDAFAHHGVILDRPMPNTVTNREPTRIRGRYYGDHPRVALHRKSVTGGSWLDQCVAVDDKGRFEFEISWPHTRWSAGMYWLMLTGASAECLAPGWSWSYEIRLR